MGGQGMSTQGLTCLLSRSSKVVAKQGLKIIIRLQNMKTFVISPKAIEKTCFPRLI
jgi:hypothetical protein